MSDLLTQSSQVSCPHGGSAQVSPSNQQVSTDGSLVLTESDQHQVAGCPFTIGNTPSPCIRIEWTSVQSSTHIGGQKALTNQSVGICYSGQNAPQGTALKVNRKRAGAT